MVEEELANKNWNKKVLHLFGTKHKRGEGRMIHVRPKIASICPM